jgi:hypothetical protein
MTGQPTPLTQLILGILTPMMQAAGLTDPTLARQAAQEAIEAGPPGPLTTTAQTIAFAMAALDNLRLAAPPEVAVTTKLRLRGNANALNRSSQRTARTAAEPPAPKPAASKPPTPEPSASEPQPKQPDRTVALAWAEAMTDVAAECARDLAKLPAKQRRAEIIRINALHATARQIRADATKPPPQSAPAPHLPPADIGDDTPSPLKHPGSRTHVPMVSPAPNWADRPQEISTTDEHR